jgi:hypothetical protein
MITSRFLAGAVAVLATLALAASAAAPASAAAASPSAPAFALSALGSSGSLHLRGTPGQALHGTVLVRNLTRHPVTVLLHPADIQNASNGNADFVTTPLTRTGLWLTLTSQTVRLAPGARTRVGFTARIPAGARGASHYAGIVAIDASDLATVAAHKTAKGKSFTFFQINRQALPITIRLPGPLTRSLAVRSAKLTVAPVGAGLTLSLLPGGSELIQNAAINVRVLRGARTIFRHSSTLGQLFPGASLDYRIPWPGKPTPGSYQVTGVIRPQGAAAVTVNQTVDYSPAKAALLKHETPPTPGPPAPSTPGWVWAALAAAAALLVTLSIAVWKLARRRPA